MLADRQPFGGFEVVSASSFSLSFGVSCLLAWLIRPAIFRLSPAFVVWSFFLCHRHLWSLCFLCHRYLCTVSFMSFSAVGIHVRLFVFALLALVSGYQSISQFFAIMLCACCSSASSYESRTVIFSKLVTLWTALQNSALKQTPFGIPPWSLRNRTQRNARYANGRDWGAASKSARLNCTNLTHFRLTAGRFRRNSCIVILWVACELLHFAATQ